MLVLFFFIFTLFCEDAICTDGSKPWFWNKTKFPGVFVKNVTLTSTIFQMNVTSEDTLSDSGWLAAKNCLENPDVCMEKGRTKLYIINPVCKNHLFSYYLFFKITRNL